MAIPTINVIMNFSFLLNFSLTIIVDIYYNASLNIKALGQRVQALTPAIVSVA
jgi:hypothetical protein